MSLLPRLALAAMLAVAGAVPALAEPDAGLAGRLDEAIDRALTERRIVGAVVLVARDGDVVYRRAAGLRDRETGAPMTEDTIFRLASITKPYVAAAAMRLVEEGIIGLDDPVANWLPGFRPRLADGTEPVIRIRHLLSHRAGLSYGFLESGGEGPYRRAGISDGLAGPDVSLEENVRRIASVPLAYPPGEGWRYSVAMDVMGAVLEAATGEPLPDIVARLVTEPLDMDDTAFTVTDRDRLAVPYADGADEPVRMGALADVPLGDSVVRFAPGRVFDESAFPSGGAGMVGTAGDLLAFLEAVRTGGAPILKARTVETMMADRTGPQAQTQGPGWGFGIGWAVLDDPEAAGTPQAKGTIQWGGAYGHSWFVDPARGLTVVALTDTAFEGMSGRFPVEIRDAVYGR